MEFGFYRALVVSYTADPPAMNCKRSVTAAVDKSDVRLVCRVTSDHPLIDARITWDGQQHLRPSDRPGWPPGVRFDSDGEYRAYLRQVMCLCVKGRPSYDTIRYCDTKCSACAEKLTYSQLIRCLHCAIVAAIGRATDRRDDRTV